MNVQKSVFRKNVIIGAAELAGIVAGVYGLYELCRAPTYEEALFDPSKRQAYVQRLLEDKPSFVDIQYGFEGLDKKLLEYPRGTLVEGEDELAVTIPFEFRRVLVEEYGLPKFIAVEKPGTRSMIVVTDECFNPLYERASEEEIHDLDLFIRNVVNKHERLHAVHNYSGFPQYDSSNFRRWNGDPNPELCSVVTELLAYQAEYYGLKEMVNKEKAGVLSYNMDLKKEGMLPYYQMLFNPTITYDMDPKFIERLRHELSPDVLLGQ